METDRLLLRAPVSGDVEAIFERYAGDPDVTRFLSWARHTSLVETRAFIDFSDAEWRKWRTGPLLVFSRADGQLLGGTGLMFETPYRAATGYVFARDAWGKGYATEALSAMSELAAVMGVSRLSAICHPEHRASLRVMEKCGFEREGILKRHTVFPNLSPAPADVVSYARIF